MKQSPKIDFHLPEGWDRTKYKKTGFTQSVLAEIQETGECRFYNDKDEYLKLIAWCNIQRYWYYIICENQVSDLEYDKVEQRIKELEALDPTLLDSTPFSPTKVVGSACIKDYPPSIVYGVFRYHPKNEIK